MESFEQIGRLAKQAGKSLPFLPGDIIARALKSSAGLIVDQTETILAANAIDLENARSKNLSKALLDRLTLTPDRITAMAGSVELIADLPEPVGKTLSHWDRPNGLRISRVAVPLGVLGIIYESRPNVTADAIALCLKSRNCAILRGGSEAIHSSKAIFDIFQSTLHDLGVPDGSINLITDTSREIVGEMLASEYIDVIIPRGGKGLTERVMNEAKMPVFAHLDGVCHTYIHASADPDIARRVVVNAKMRRTGICGATETLLIDKSFEQPFSQLVISDLLKNGCRIVGDKAAQKLDPHIEPATDEDWGTEYLDAKISIRMVDDVQAAVDHISAYGSHHTDSIISEDVDATNYFLRHVDSAIVMHNTSTQFADGGEFGMGAEIGIATGKFHARGPVGVEQLTTYKYVVEGDGQIRQ